MWIEIGTGTEAVGAWPGHHLAGGVDWNYNLNFPHTPTMVTTLRVVWIEISPTSSKFLPIGSPPCGWCGLKSEWMLPFFSIVYVTTLRVVWIEIGYKHIPPGEDRCHHLAGGVDWNFKLFLCLLPLIVTTLRVVWIEIYPAISISPPEESPPCGWCGLKSLTCTSLPECH